MIVGGNIADPDSAADELQINFYLATWLLPNSTVNEKKNTLADGYSYIMNDRNFSP